MQSELPEKLVLFDGECNFCSGVVQFLLKFNKRESLFFASLQSDLGKRVLNKFDIREDTIVYVVRQVAYTKIDAVFLILDELCLPFSLLKIFKILPKTILNNLYDIFAKNRYLVFGKAKTCVTLAPKFKKRFLS